MAPYKVTLSPAGDIAPEPVGVRGAALAPVPSLSRRLPTRSRQILQKEEKIRSVRPQEGA